MRAQDVVDLIIIGAIWGSSFLFMRLAVPELGPFPLMALRAGLALAVLVPSMLIRGKLPDLIRKWRHIFVIGITNAALPFTLLAYAALKLPVGVISVLSASAPLWGALITMVWLKEKLSRLKVAGLVIGIVGIVLLVGDEIDLDGLLHSGLALIASLLAPMSYGFSASYTKRNLMGTSATAVACGCLLSATIVLTPFAWLTWPETPVSSSSWTSVLMLGLLCTGFAQILFYRMLMNVGPAKASTVALLVPVFGIFWGWSWLDEPVKQNMAWASFVVLIGVAFATGIIGEKGLIGSRKSESSK